jgi:4-methyl-5(b-hydroxyethyl)-thiazole monophosphate biosynthesis
MVYMLLAEGFEEIEAVYPLDILRRCGVEVRTIGINSEYVTGSNKITIKSDMEITSASIKTDDVTMLILPGGPGRVNILKSEEAMELVKSCCDKDIPIAAICGAPEVLGETGALKGKRFTCYPGLEKGLDGEYVNQPIVVDTGLITSQAAGTSEQFAFAIAEFLCGKEKADEIAVKTRANHKT